MTERIKTIDAYQIFDSRGTPTVECQVTLDSGITGFGRVPSGASTGQHEARELRDGDPRRFAGRSVFTAIDNIKNVIGPAIIGSDVCGQEDIDGRLIDLDGTPDKSRLGCNALLGVSMAVANAASNAMRIPLYEYLGKGLGTLLPLPEIQIFGGGAHADWRVDVQDFLLIVTCSERFEDTFEVAHDVYQTAGRLMSQQGRSAGVADEGGYWPVFDSNESVLEFFVQAVSAAGYEPGRDCAIALDFAASDLYDGVHYRLRLDDRRFTTDEFVDFIEDWCRRYPIVSIEDPLSDSDWGGWTRLYEKLGKRLQIIGDDLFTTNVRRIRKGVEENSANAVLIKPNQIGTISETIAAIRLTRKSGWQPVISARSGETEDTFIAHLAVATNAGQIKVGSFSRGERMAKWNELIRINRQLGKRGRYEGGRMFADRQQKQR